MLCALFPSGMENCSPWPCQSVRHSSPVFPFGLSHLSVFYLHKPQTTECYVVNTHSFTLQMLGLESQALPPLGKPQQSAGMPGDFLHILWGFLKGYVFPNLTSNVFLHQKKKKNKTLLSFGKWKRVYSFGRKLLVLRTHYQTLRWLWWPGCPAPRRHCSAEISVLYLASLPGSNTGQDFPEGLPCPMVWYSFWVFSWSMIYNAVLFRGTWIVTLVI